MDNKGYAKLAAKAWSQPGFAQQLYENPQEALSSVGLNFEGVTASIVLVRDGKAWMNIPQKPAALSGKLQDSKTGVMEDCSCHVAEDEV